MGTRAIFASQRPESRIVRLPSGMGLLSSQPGPNPDNDNSAVVITFQVVYCSPPRALATVFVRCDAPAVSTSIPWLVRLAV